MPSEALNCVYLHGLLEATYDSTTARGAPSVAAVTHEGSNETEASTKNYRLGVLCNVQQIRLETSN